jgi:hypothetical protein
MAADGTATALVAGVDDALHAALTTATSNQPMDRVRI